MSKASGHQSRFPCPRALWATGHFAPPAKSWSFGWVGEEASVLCFSICFILSWQSELLPGRTPGRAPGTQSAENEFAFAKHTLAERGCGGPGHVIPVNVLDIAAP